MKKIFLLLFITICILPVKGQINDITPFEEIFENNIKIDELSAFLKTKLGQMIGNIELVDYTSENAMGFTSALYKSRKSNIYEYEIVFSADSRNKRIMHIGIGSNCQRTREGVLESLKAKGYHEINSLLAKSGVDHYFIGDTNPRQIPGKKRELKIISVATVNTAKNKLEIYFFGREPQNLK